ncbi:glucose-1-phosphate thymidylyltransferase [Streptomyces yokosukanensis]|uniref:Glucose-1-phosphate thymidylyltransferase n=1 Tax=Streptomyces yokosukanensis TaxID=67386 RepID=A0A117PZ86_9ACTN|nr:glucose-1-phosphate thymidylyltransferase [Streptomyces yokosukanensis]KUN00448.1 glucose-1-phosphate thymidylyltransferase [Streptomyces yokosukanensis]
MKALVLAAGTGSRLRPVTHTGAKQLVPVANKPVLFYALEAIAAARVTDVGIVVGPSADDIREAVDDGSHFGLDVTYIRQEEPLGLAHAVQVSQDFLGDDDFLMYLGDNFVGEGVAHVAAEFRRQRPAAQILLTAVADPTAFGVAELDAEGRVVSLEEKPRVPKSDLAVMGVYLFTSAIHEAIREIKPSARGELEITHAIQWLIEDGRDVRSTISTGYWRDTGNVADMLDVNRHVLDSTVVDHRVAGDVDADSRLTGRVHVAPGARVVRSRIEGPVVIGPGAVVVGSRIGPHTSIAEDCEITGSDIESSIVLCGSTVRDVPAIAASLIGRHTSVVSARPGETHQLVLGDHTRVTLAS